MGNHAGRAIKLYKWDAEISAALWNLVALVEVVLRNKICTQAEIWSDANVPRSNRDWIMQPRQNVQEPLSKVSASISDPAIRKALKAKKVRDEGTGLTRGSHPRKGQPITKDDVISQVTLSQWNEYFFYRAPTQEPNGSVKYYPDETTYEFRKAIYEKITCNAFSALSDSDRIDPDDVSRIMNRVVLLRNRIGHQEPLIDIDCGKSREDLLTLLKHLDTAVLSNYTASDPIPKILKADPRIRQSRR
ncbi:hypothetical protein CIG21_09535 [Corynebacterium hadale]|uniref:CAAX protease n=2 Tax=Corynebacteriaceae TaxID=1653 RepID=A0A269PDH6_9CORY|nr:hypothetical protein CIG21_09535 [Corynebacterium hadale]